MSRFKDNVLRSVLVRMKNRYLELEIEWSYWIELKLKLPTTYLDVINYITACTE
jgi:hypothetical protein